MTDSCFSLMGPPWRLEAAEDVLKAGNGLEIDGSLGINKQIN